jgi:3-hydroxyacyl-[acyl-carrier-protein] dehydratase
MSAAPLPMPVDVTRIQALLPHRYPFLLVDRVLELEPNQRILAVKCVSINEPFFQGHFPGHPVMPGVLVLEALAQAGGLLTQLSLGEGAEKQDKLFYLVKIDNARFSNMAMYECCARVDGKQVASADILCAEGRS